ncbi:hypothetical protein AAVH_03927 [Aphelenchoides avenae]|nr:hypothetical protein AAVH_03927 [Aphelenchus avenae]
MDILFDLPSNNVGRHKHPVWTFFSIDEKTLAPTCRSCLIQFNGPPNTTNAKKHLKTRHPDLHDEMERMVTERTSKDGSESRSVNGETSAERNGDVPSEFSQNFDFTDASLTAVLSSLAAGTSNGSGFAFATTTSNGDIKPETLNGELKQPNPSNGDLDHPTSSPVANSHNDQAGHVQKRKRRCAIRPSAGATAEVTATNLSMNIHPNEGNAERELAPTVSTSVGSYVSSVHAELGGLDPVLALEFEEQCVQLCLKFRRRSLCPNQQNSSHNNHDVA